jgi:hypothetical protein
MQKPKSDIAPCGCLVYRSLECGDCGHLHSTYTRCSDWSCGCPEYKQSPLAPHHGGKKCDAAEVTAALFGELLRQAKLPGGVLNDQAV